MFRLWLDFFFTVLSIILISSSALAYLIGYLEFQATVVLILSSIGILMAGSTYMLSHLPERTSESFQRPRRARRDTRDTA